MKIIAAPDSFKGSMTAHQAAAAMANGIHRVLPSADVVAIPMADGGEGTAQSLVDATGGRLIHTTVSDPLGRQIAASFGLLGDGASAVIEMAAASGLTLLEPHERDPLITTTLGAGELIRAALDFGCTRLIVGLGGSATNDGGAGAMVALGARLLDRSGAELGPGGAELCRLWQLDLAGLDPRLARCEIVVACDVDNPLTGPEGASAVFGPQKGATPAMVSQLDQALRHWASIIRKTAGVEVEDIPGSGAAGGLGAALIAFGGAKLRPGVEIVLEATRFREKCAGADLVLTGEGRIDRQSVHGKTPVGVARAAKALGLPVIALVGTIGPGAHTVYQAGIDAMLPLAPGPISLRESISRGPALMADAAERAMRLFLLGQAAKP